MRGVMAFTTDGGIARSCRFFLEPVDTSADSIDAAVARHVGSAAAG
jgi:hypothetical protein